MFQILIIQILRITINQYMFIVKLILLCRRPRYNSTQYLLNMLNINQMRQNLRLFKKSHKRNSRHSFILQLNFSVIQQNSILMLQSPIILIHINQIQIFQLFLKLRQHSHRTLHKNFSIRLIHLHNSRIVHRILISNNLLS
jgi:hypothetical protein